MHKQDQSEDKIIFVVIPTIEKSASYDYFHNMDKE